MIRDRVRRLGNYAVPWFTLLLRRFERIISSAAATERHHEDQLAEPPPATKEQLSLRARVAAFLLDRAQVLQRLPTLEEVFQAFPNDDLGSRSSFYRRNPWYTTLRAATKKTLQDDAPRKGHRNASDDDNAGELDARVDAPEYHRDEAC